jgi:hypothetical protein
MPGKRWEELTQEEKIEELHEAVGALDEANRAQAVRLGRAIARIAKLEKALSRADEQRA